MSLYPSLTFEELERVARDNTDPLVIELLRRWMSCEDDALELEQKFDELQQRFEACQHALDQLQHSKETIETLRADVARLTRKPLPDTVIQGLADEFNLPLDRLHDFQRVTQFGREIERQHGIK